jgi:hypothetical protein
VAGDVMIGMGYNVMGGLQGQIKRKRVRKGISF